MHGTWWEAGLSASLDRLFSWLTSLGPDAFVLAALGSTLSIACGCVLAALGFAGHASGRSALRRPASLAVASAIVLGVLGVLVGAMVAMWFGWGMNRSGRY